jgi:hypothetical protein
MKIDVEGHEYSVLKGAENMLLNKSIDIIQLEINSTISNSGKSIDDVVELLLNYKYNFCKYDVLLNELVLTSVSENRENYFAVSNLDKCNLKLKNLASSL